MMNENELQETGFVRADYLQRLAARQRMQARMNIRAAKLPPITQALVYGLDLLALTPLSPPDGMLADDGGAVMIILTAGGHWSSDGNETAPEVGPWLMFEKTVTEETDVPGETNDGDENFPLITQNVVSWQAIYAEDGVQDPVFDWRSETIHEALAEDLFAFRAWRPYPDTEISVTEEGVVPSESAVWFQPIEPAPSAGGGASFTEILEADYEALSPPDADTYYDITDLMP